DVARSDGSVRERHAGLDVVVFLNENLARQRYEVTAYVAALRGDDDFTVAAFDFAERNLAVDFRHDGRVRRVAGLEQFRNAGQTARDVARLAERTRYLDERIARLDFGVLLYHDVCAYRQVVLFHLVALVVEDADDGVLR